MIGLLWFEFGVRNKPELEIAIPEQELVDSEAELADNVQQVINRQVTQQRPIAPEQTCLTQQIKLPQDQQYRIEVKPIKYHDAFSAQLHSRVQVLLANYERFIDQQRMRNVELKLIFLSPKQFDDFLTSRGHSGASYQGIYYPGGNIAFVKVLNNEQALKTATHELTHAINAQLFGVGFPRFLNEGLAEYLEHYPFIAASQQNKQRFNVLDYWSKETARDELLDFYTLINSEQDWHTSNNLSLYFSGALWTQFLMSKPEGLAAISTLLKAKADSPCRKMSADDIVDAFVHTYPDFEQEFYYFFDELIHAIESM